jgi:hypothetical protein
LGRRERKAMGGAAPAKREVLSYDLVEERAKKPGARPAA